MDANELTPDNDSVDKLKQSHVVGSFLFITDQEFVESIKKECVTSTTQRCARGSRGCIPTPSFRASLSPWLFYYRYFYFGIGSKFVLEVADMTVDRSVGVVIKIFVLHKVCYHIIGKYAAGVHNEQSEQLLTNLLARF